MIFDLKQFVECHSFSAVDIASLASGKAFLAETKYENISRPGQRDISEKS